VSGRLAGYEDVNDADRLGRDPAMHWVVGDRAVTKSAASTSQMGHFETGAPSASLDERKRRYRAGTTGDWGRCRQETGL
jgi:hypothetical protein